MDRQGDQLKTTLANHFDFDIQIAVDNHNVLFVSLKIELRLHRTDSVGKRVAESFQISELQRTLEGYATIG